MGETLDIAHSGVQLAYLRFVFLSFLKNFFLNDKTGEYKLLEAMKPCIS